MENRGPGESGSSDESLKTIIQAGIKEYRRTRRWQLFFRLLLVAVIIGILAVPAYYTSETLAGPHTALVELDGIIGVGNEISADTAIKGIREALEDEQTRGLILRINSPGGSPVQANQINREIGRLREIYPDKPVIAVVDDICASGGYYIAVAAERIFVDQASLVGSIGVLMNGFGFVDTLQKLGIERRLLTAGENKALLDPFSPVKGADQRHAQAMLDRIHEQFIAAVKTGRGERLSSESEIFSGLFWTGDRAIELGLADELGTADMVAREVIGAEEIVDYTLRGSLMDRFARELGVSFANILSTRVITQKFGLY